MRIVSLVPHATELLFALGLGDDVVGVTHECDHPPAVADLPQVTRDVLPPGLSTAEIDAEVRERTDRGEAIYALDEDLLAELEPDLIVTQDLCPVCAVSSADVGRGAATLLEPARPRALATHPGPPAAALGRVARQRAPIDPVRRAVRGADPVPVAALEWLDPL